MSDYFGSLRGCGWVLLVFALIVGALALTGAFLLGRWLS